MAHKAIAKGSRTPWGAAQWVDEVLPGMTNVSTAGHGGIFLGRERNSLIPPYMRNASGWYEEDCEWSIPFCVFEAELVAHGIPCCFNQKTIADGLHKKTLRQWYPQWYEKFYEKEVRHGA